VRASPRSSRSGGRSSSPADPHRRPRAPGPNHSLLVPRTTRHVIGLKCVVRGFPFGRPGRRRSSQASRAPSATKQKRSASPCTGRFRPSQVRRGHRRSGRLLLGGCTRPAPASQSRIRTPPMSPMRSSGAGGRCDESDRAGGWRRGVRDHATRGARRVRCAARFCFQLKGGLTRRLLVQLARDASTGAGARSFARAAARSACMRGSGQQRGPGRLPLREGERQFPGRRRPHRWSSSNWRSRSRSARAPSRTGGAGPAPVDGDDRVANCHRWLRGGGWCCAFRAWRLCLRRGERWRTR